MKHLRLSVRNMIYLHERCWGNPFADFNNLIYGTIVNHDLHGQGQPRSQALSSIQGTV
jgi:hypothetical protein